MLIDDSERSYNLAREYLRGFKVGATFGASGEQVLQICWGSLFDSVFVGCRMPLNLLFNERLLENVPRRRGAIAKEKEVERETL